MFLSHIIRKHSCMNTITVKILLITMLLSLPLMAGSSRSTHQGKLETERYSYTGGVCEGKQNGYGVCRYHNGNVYYGYWNMGYKEGLGRMIFADGTWISAIGAGALLPKTAIRNSRLVNEFTESMQPSIRNKSTGRVCRFEPAETV